MSIDVTLLGSLRVEVEGEELAQLPDRPMRAALLAYLATERSVDRHAIIDDFQKRGEDPEKTRRRLNQTLFVLRGDFDDAAGNKVEWVRSRGDIMVVSDSVHTDLQAFEAAIASGDHGAAFAAYRGEFLTGRDSLKDAPNYEPWVARTRDRLRRDHQSVSLELIRTSSAAGDLEHAIDVARRWVELDPLDDRGQDQLIRALVAADRRTEALQQYLVYEDAVWRAFGDAPWESTRALIESLDPRHTSTVDELRERDAAATEALGAAPNSLVVSWFDAETAEVGGQARAGGLVRRVQAGVARLDELAVLPITSTVWLKDQGLSDLDAASRLNVAWVLGASVVAAGDQLEVHASIVRARDGKRWRSTFRSTTVEDEFRLHREVAHWVANTVTGAMEGEGEAAAAVRRARKAKAMSLFDVAYSGYEDRSAPGFEVAADKLQEALAVDPNFARAHAKLADVLIAQAQFSYRKPSDTMPRALAAANKALEIDPDQWEAYAARGHYRDTYEWDWVGAESDYLAAIRLNPDDFNARTWYADMLTALGRGRESRVQIRQAEEAHPLSPAVQWSKGVQHYRAGRHAQAIDSLNRALVLKPGYAIALVFRAFALTASGQPEVAARGVEAVKAASPTPVPIVELAIGVARKALGDVEAVRQCHAVMSAVSQVAYVPAALRAILLGQLGDLDAAFDELELAMEERWGQLIYLEVDPVYGPLRDDPRYQGFVNRLGLR